MVIPGSLADLKAACGNGDQAPFGAWCQRNRELVVKVAAGAVECCGEWQRPGYYGWCSLLTRPVGVDADDSICPRARQAREDQQASQDWIDSFFSFLEDLENGNWTGSATRH